MHLWIPTLPINMCFSFFVTIKRRKQTNNLSLAVLLYSSAMISSQSWGSNLGGISAGFMPSFSILRRIWNDWSVATSSCFNNTSASRFPFVLSLKQQKRRSTISAHIIHRPTLRYLSKAIDCKCTVPSGLQAGKLLCFSQWRLRFLCRVLLSVNPLVPKRS